MTPNCSGKEEGAEGREVLGYGTVEGTNPEDTKGLVDPERRGSQQPEPAQHLLGVVGPL